jgi:hypothetical protein
LIDLCRFHYAATFPGADADDGCANADDAGGAKYDDSSQLIDYVSGKPLLPMIRTGDDGEWRKKVEVVGDSVWLRMYLNIRKSKIEGHSAWEIALLCS